MPLKQQQPYPEDRPLECGSCRKGIAVRYFEKEIKQEELSHQRASYIHTLLKKISLKL